MMKKNFASRHNSYKILSVDQPQMIKGQNCSIIRLEDIEQAELFCVKW